MSQRLNIDGIEVEWRSNSRRRTRIGMAFDPAGFVIMDAPPGATEDEIRAIVAEHNRWLQVRLRKVQQSTQSVRALRYETGELVHYLGEAYRLEVGQGETAVALHERGQAQLPLFGDGAIADLVVSAPDVSAAAVEQVLSDWFRERAAEVFAEQIERWRHLPWLDGRLPKWHQRFMRSQWGSCSTDGRISLNTHLVKAPVRLLDYVILHELCHLKHHNHGKSFYSLMDQHMPNWQRRRTELDRFLPVLLH